MSHIESYWLDDRFQLEFKPIEFFSFERIHFALFSFVPRIQQISSRIFQVGKLRPEVSSETQLSLFEFQSRFIVRWSVHNWNAWNCIVTQFTYFPVGLSTLLDSNFFSKLFLLGINSLNFNCSSIVNANRPWRRHSWRIHAPSLVCIIDGLHRGAHCTEGGLFLVIRWMPHVVTWHVVTCALINVTDINTAIIVLWGSIQQWAELKKLDVGVH